VSRLFGGIEAGGTKFVCAVGTGPGDIRSEDRFSTGSPGETLEKCVEFFRSHADAGSLTAIGIASFGPLDLRPDSATFGFITATTKPGWDNTDVAGTLTEGVGVPVTIDTDVNAAALGENVWGAARGLDTFIYLTIGTGIGGGGMAGGRPLHGLVHPEMGHLRIPHDTARDPFPGCCPYHGDCLEGLASGPALEQRWGTRAEELPPDHPAWELEAEYLALALVDYIVTLSPQRVIMGGGVMERGQLFYLVRARVLELLGGYVRAPEVLDAIDDFIVPPSLGNRAGVLGAIALARSQAR